MRFFVGYSLSTGDMIRVNLPIENLNYIVMLVLRFFSYVKQNGTREKSDLETA